MKAKHQTRSRQNFLFIPTIIFAAVLCSFPIANSLAGSATWLASPVSGVWSNALNWTAGGPPNGLTDTATFGSSSITGISLTANTSVAGMTYSPGSSAFTSISASSLGRLFFYSTGITNNSGIAQNFVTDITGGGQGGISFFNSASAGTSTTFTNAGGGVSAVAGGFTEFYNLSTAASGVFVVNGGTVSGALGGFIEFNDTSNAGSGTFTGNAGAVGASGGLINFFENSSGGTATFTMNGGAASGAGGGSIRFFDSSNAGAGTLFANGGTNGGAGGNVQFNNDSTGGTIRIQLSGSSTMDLSSHNAASTVTIGSIAGDGSVSLGNSKLSIGGNNLTTTYSGPISGGSGALIKIGTGTLTLTGSNTFAGGTTINAGTLLVKRSGGSSTGTGAVTVNGGTFGGNAQVFGAVTIGNGTGTAAFLAPGVGSIGTLTLQKKLTFKSDGTLNFQISSTTQSADKITAKGVVIGTGALFSFTDLGSATLPLGTTFTVIGNNAATPISGTFANLADGSVFTNNGNNYQVSYSGGDGNNLTLTVVP